MDFRKVLAEALKICGEHADNPFLLYCTLCDCARNDYTASPQVEMFHRFNKIYDLVAEMKKNPEPRMIGTLLERCREQPDASEKLCLKWIHTIFEFYYRAKHGERKDTKQILKSVEEDFIEPEHEGIVLPRQKKPKQKAPRRQPSTPPITVQNQSNFLPVKRYISKTSLPLSNAIYKVLPDNACVYKSENERHLHLSTQCPCIRPALNLMLYKATYDRARYKDFVTLNGFTKNTTAYQQMSRSHIPPVCAICGDFTPILFHKPQKIIYKQL